MNGGGTNSLSDETFIDGEIESRGNRQQGYIFNGNSSNAAVHLKVYGTGYYDFAPFYQLPNVTFDLLCGAAFSPSDGCVFGTPPMYADTVHNRSVTIELPSTSVLCSGCYSVLTTPGTSGTLAISDASFTASSPLVCTDTYGLLTTVGCGNGAEADHINSGILTGGSCTTPRGAFTSCSSTVLSSRTRCELCGFLHRHRSQWLALHYRHRVKDN